MMGTRALMTMGLPHTSLALRRAFRSSFNRFWRSSRCSLGLQRSVRGGAGEEKVSKKGKRERERKQERGRGPSFSRLDLLPPLIDPKTAEVLSGDQKIRVADLPRKAQGRVCHLVRHPQDDDIEVAAGQAQPCGLRAEEHCA